MIDKQQVYPFANILSGPRRALNYTTIFCIFAVVFTAICFVLPSIINAFTVWSK